MDSFEQNVFAGAHWIAEYIRRRAWTHSPVFRKRFTVDHPERAQCAVCGLGFFELYLNGRKVGNDLMTPAFTRYDVRCEYYVYEVGAYLKPGENVAEIRLGNGFYNQGINDILRSECAMWKNDPRFLLKLTSAAQTLLVSDEQWLVAHGPILNNSIRTGECYDARRELADWLPGDTPDPKIWHRVYRSDSPGGELTLATAPPCRVVRKLAPAARWITRDGAQILDFGENIAGNCEIKVSGAAGQSIRLIHGEKLNDERDLDNSHIGLYTFAGDFQTDRYTLAGRGSERWSPTFGYHGFQYVKVFADPGVVLQRIEARVIRSDFAEIGAVNTSDPTLNELVVMARRSYESNFVNLPTDCPHREKFGWTGDAQLMCELGLWYYRSDANYRAWLHSMRDCQRRSGQVPGIVPLGQHWQFGPVWDSALILIPFQVWKFTGDREIVRENYAAGRALMNYFASLAQNDLIEFGPGDWCHVHQEQAIPGIVDASAYYFVCAQAMAVMAEIAGCGAEQSVWRELAARIRTAFQEQFYHGDGHYCRDEVTALGLALECGLAAPEDRGRVAFRLDELVRRNECRADFGIVGAKVVPRALAHCGYFDTALRLLTQRQYPGWGWWLEQGATSFWETWRGEMSRNHVMFGDVGAWCMEYACGVRPEIAAPGFRHFTVSPPESRLLTSCEMNYHTPHGLLAWRWHGENGAFEGELRVPEGCRATFRPPHRAEVELDVGIHRMAW